MGYIDAHIHVWTQDVANYPILPEYEPENMKPLTFLPEELLSHCRPHGVDRVVLIQMSYYGTDNSYMLDTIARFPDVFRGVAIIDHTAPDAADQMAGLRAAGARGFRIQPGGANPDEWLDDDAYGAMFAHAGELGMTICPLIDCPYLPAIGRAAQRHPGTNFAVDHLARIGVGDKPIDQQDVGTLCALAQWPNCMVKVSAFYALGSGKAPHDDLIPMIREVYEAFGADRLMWATDCPYQVERGTYEASIALIRDRMDFLSAAEIDAILGGTAERVFFSD